METTFTRPEQLNVPLARLGSDQYHLFVNGRWVYAHADPGMLMRNYHAFEALGCACTVVCAGEIVLYCARRLPLLERSEHDGTP